MSENKAYDLPCLGEPGNGRTTKGHRARNGAIAGVAGGLALGIGLGYLGSNYDHMIRREPRYTVYNMQSYGPHEIVGGARRAPAVNRHAEQEGRTRSVRNLVRRAPKEEKPTAKPVHNEPLPAITEGKWHRSFPEKTPEGMSIYSNNQNYFGTNPNPNRKEGKPQIAQQQYVVPSAQSNQKAPIAQAQQCMTGGGGRQCASSPRPIMTVLKPAGETVKYGGITAKNGVKLGLDYSWYILSGIGSGIWHGISWPFSRVHHSCGSDQHGSKGCGR